MATHPHDASPCCRGKIEGNINAVSRGQRTKDDVLQEAVTFFKADFLAAQRKQGKAQPVDPTGHDDCVSKPARLQHHHSSTENFCLKNNMHRCVCSLTIFRLPSKGKAWPKADSSPPILSTSR